MMSIAGLHLIATFSKSHPKSQSALETWAKLARNAEWRTFADIRQTFGSVDKVGVVFVFNIGGNKFRLVATVNIAHRFIRIQGIYTHAEYSKLDLKRRE